MVTYVNSRLKFFLTIYVFFFIIRKKVLARYYSTSILRLTRSSSNQARSFEVVREIPESALSTCGITNNAYLQ